MKKTSMLLLSLSLFLNGFSGLAAASSANDEIVFRFVVDTPLRAPESELEWVDGSPEGVLCFDGVAKSTKNPKVVVGNATGCARIVNQFPLAQGDAVLALRVRHIIRLRGGDIIDDDFAIVTPLFNSPTNTFTHGLTATTDINNIIPELGSRRFKDRAGTVGVNGNMNLADFPNSLVFNALFTIQFER